MILEKPWVSWKTKIPKNGGDLAKSGATTKRKREHGVTWGYPTFLGAIFFGSKIHRTCSYSWRIDVFFWETARRFFCCSEFWEFVEGRASGKIYREMMTQSTGELIFQLSVGGGYKLFSFSSPFSQESFPIQRTWTSDGWFNNQTTLRLPTPPMETPDPPFMTPRKGPPNRWQLDTQNDIPYGV